MSFGAKPMGPPPLRPRPPSRGDTAFAVGSRALITPTGSNTATVSLLDEDGMPTQLNLPADATVVITAWRPRRSAPPRYRVCSPDKVEGWIDAANLRRLPPPPPPAPSIVLTPPPAPAGAKGAKTSAKTSAKAAPAKAAQPKAAAAKPGAKVATPPPTTPAKPAAKAVAPKPAPASAKPAAKAVAKPAAKAKARPASAAKTKPKAPAGKPKSKRAR
jgi:hypothetical protein